MCMAPNGEGGEQVRETIETGVGDWDGRWEMPSHFI
jgi:hypothetical protein